MSHDMHEVLNIHAYVGLFRTVIKVDVHVPLLGNNRYHGKLWLQTRSVVAGWQFIQELKLKATSIAAVDRVRLRGVDIESVRNLD